jgi:hypothetical protein
MAMAVLSGVLSMALAAWQFGVCDRIATRRTDRFRAKGRAGKQNRSSRPEIIPTQTGKALAKQQPGRGPGVCAHRHL